MNLRKRLRDVLVSSREHLPGAPTPSIDMPSSGGLVLGAIFQATWHGADASLDQIRLATGLSARTMDRATRSLIETGHAVWSRGRLIASPYPEPADPHRHASRIARPHKPKRAVFQDAQARRVGRDEAKRSAIPPGVQAHQVDAEEPRLGSGPQPPTRTSLGSGWGPGGVPCATLVGSHAPLAGVRVGSHAPLFPESGVPCAIFPVSEVREGSEEGEGSEGKKVSKNLFFQNRSASEVRSQLSFLYGCTYQHRNGIEDVDASLAPVNTNDVSMDGQPDRSPRPMHSPDLSIQGSCSHPKRASEGRVARGPLYQKSKEPAKEKASKGSKVDKTETNDITPSIAPSLLDSSKEVGPRVAEATTVPASGGKSNAEIMGSAGASDPGFCVVWSCLHAAWGRRGQWGWTGAGSRAKAWTAWQALTADERRDAEKKIWAYCGQHLSSDRPLKKAVYWIADRAWLSQATNPPPSANTAATGSNFQFGGPSRAQPPQPGQNVKRPAPRPVSPPEPWKAPPESVKSGLGDLAAYLKAQTATGAIHRLARRLPAAQQEIRNRRHPPLSAQELADYMLSVQ